MLQRREHRYKMGATFFPYLLTVLLSIPFNELPCVSGIRPKNGQQNGQGRQSMKQTKSHNQEEYLEKSAEYMRFRSCQ